jgi:hypothetical protein
VQCGRRCTLLLGKAPLTASKLVSAITAGFPFHAPPVDQAIFFRRELERLGSSLAYKMVRTQPGRPIGEPHFDVTWWEPGRGTILAAECEWGVAGDVAAAFQTLMSVKAPMKLLIFRSRHAGGERQDISLRTDIDAVLKAVGAAILDFSQHIKGETYVLLECVEQESLLRSYEFRVPASGKLALRFEEAAQVFRALDGWDPMR